jgi:hypothetical protein
MESGQIPMDAYRLLSIYGTFMESIVTINLFLQTPRVFVYPYQDP